MAWLVSLNLSQPPNLSNAFPFHNHILRELKAPARHVASSLLLRRSTVKITSPACTSKCATRQRQDSQRHVVVPCRDYFGIVSLLSDVSRSPRVLMGYWVGPDTEDGWGFVEAFIHEIL